MAYRLILSVVVAGLSLLMVTDAQIPVGAPEEISPEEFQRAMTGQNPVPAGGIGVPQFNRIPFVRQGLIRRPGPIPAQFNQRIQPVFPNMFGRNALVRGPIVGNQVGMIAPGMRIVPTGNNIRAIRQQQLQQEAIRRAQISQRFRPFVNATPPRFGVVSVQQASAIQQNRVQPNILQSSTVDLSRFPNFGTINGNTLGNQLINQLMSFQQVVGMGQNAAVLPQQPAQAASMRQNAIFLPQQAARPVAGVGMGQNAVVFPQQTGQQVTGVGMRQNAIVFPQQPAQQSTPQVMPALLPADQQLLNNMLNQPFSQQPSSTQNIQTVTGNSGVLPSFPNQQPALTSLQGLSTAARNAAQIPGTGTNAPQWSFQTGNTPPVQVVPNASQSVPSQSNQIVSDQSNNGFTSQTGTGFSSQDFSGPPVTVPSLKPDNDNAPVELDEQFTIYHPGNQELCFRGRNLSPDLLKWIINILTLRTQSPDGDDLCRNRGPYTIPELVEIEKEFLAKGIDPHSQAAFQSQPNIIEVPRNNAAGGAGNPSNQLPGIPIPPSDTLVAMSNSAQVSPQSG
ncbi:uncharacterized protein [Argopecten irradians]|uniref:uncharacterized protein n=1 Tax=Argopecten irradians TaxID=31199 RepID=UPI00371DBDA5